MRFPTRRFTFISPGAARKVKRWTSKSKRGASCASANASTNCLRIIPVKPIERIIHDTDRNYYMDAAEAVEYGLIDEVLVSTKTEKKEEKK